MSRKQAVIQAAQEKLGRGGGGRSGGDVPVERRSTRNKVSNTVRDLIGGKVRRHKTQIVQEGEAREEFEENSDDDDEIMEDEDILRKKRLRMYGRPDSILEIYAEAYGYEKLGIATPNLGEEGLEKDWWSATSGGM
jgi:hypothetical protein